jgi:predicted RNase H-like HicB family nuclease
VTSPFDPNVLTQAETLEESFEMARDVIELYKEARELHP